jgi:serine/threonine protein kinase
VLATDGVYEHVAARTIVKTIGDNAADLDRAAEALTTLAHEHGSTDNLTIQIVRIDGVPDGEAQEILDHAADLPLPPLPEVRDVFDGYRIVREIHGSSRSHIYLAVDVETDALVALKLPSIDLRANPDYLKRFMFEEWIARRINSPYVLKPQSMSRKRNYLYVVMEYVEGQTLHQWMLDHPSPDLETVRGIVEQIATGLDAFHRMEMLHQDLRPNNLMIDKTGTVKIIDFGSTRVAGVIEAAPNAANDDILGTAQYTAPEYFLGEGGTPQSDLFSLGVIAYQILTGRLPYGAEIAKLRRRSQLRKLKYRGVSGDVPAVPAWVDGAIQRAVEPDPARRYDALSEFAFDLRHPNPKYLNIASRPLLERNPLLLWQLVSGILAGISLLLLVRLYGTG